MFDDLNLNPGANGGKLPLERKVLKRPLTHEEMDYNMRLINNILDDYPILGSGTNGELTSADLNKALVLTEISGEWFWVPGTSGGGGTVYFQNSNPTTATNLQGFPVGSTFPSPTSMQDMWDDLLYPYIAPSASLLASPTPLEYGDDNSGAGHNITLNWSVTKNSDSITSITVDGNTITPTGNSQSGSVSTVSTHPSTPGVSYTQTYGMQAGDGTTTTTTTADVIWMNRIYWGKIDLGGVNLTTNPSATVTITDSDILALTGAGIGTGNALSTTKNATYEDMDGAGDHLIWAWPSNVTGASTPVFTVNGLKNTAFTQIRTNSPFTNQHGFTTNYEVWVINTVQNSPVDQIIIS